jgi:hypothetical protein
LGNGEVVMKKMLGCLVMILFVPFVMVAQERVSISLPQILSKWKMGFQDQNTTRYFLERESCDKFSEIVNIQFKERKIVKCSTAAEAMKQESLLNHRVIYKVHAQGTNDLIFEKIFPTGVHEVVRMIMTDKGLHRIAYAKTEALFTESDRSQWIERLAKAEITCSAG